MSPRRAGADAGEGRAIERRTFLKQGLAAGVLIAGTGATQLAEWLQPPARGGDGPPPPRLVAAWLRMMPVTLRMTPASGQGPAFDIPTSEAAYLSNTETIDVAMPANGGKLQADGTWLQEPWKLDTRWARRLPSVARASGHRYLPIVGNDRQGIYTVLAERRLQRRAARELVALATRRRLDRRWDGVLIDLEGIPGTHRAELTAFYRLLGEHLRTAGLTVGVSVGGRPIDDGADDLAVVAEVADIVDLRCYGYRGSPPWSIAPCWWIEACIAFAQSQGITGEKLVLGLGTFCRYWPDSSVNYPNAEITHRDAARLVAETQANPRWIERTEQGKVGERYASLGPGHVWIHDEETHGVALALVSELGVPGISVFAPGMGDRHWPTTRAWRRGMELPGSPAPVLSRWIGTWHD